MGKTRKLYDLAVHLSRDVACLVDFVTLKSRHTTSSKKTRRPVSNPTYRRLPNAKRQIVLGIDLRCKTDWVVTALNLFPDGPPIAGEVWVANADCSVGDFAKLAKGLFKKNNLATTQI